MEESHDFLQAALDALSARIAVLDGRGRILAVNETWRRFAEESPAAGSALAVGGDYLAVCERGEHGLVADAGRAASAGIRSVAEGGAERFVMDYAGASPHDGRWLQMTVTRFAAPGPVRLVVAHEDITQRKQVEDRLRRSDERYRAFIEHSSEAIWRFELDMPVPITLDVDAQIDAFCRHAYLAECNDATARMYGYERAEELIGFPLADLLPRDDPANVDCFRRFVAASYRLTDGESHEHDREGRPRHFLNNLIGIVENGHLLRAWGTQRDVTERQQVEVALRDSERKLRLALEVARAGAWEEARGERRIFEYEARLRHAPSDSYRYCVARVVPVFDDDGSVREWVSSIADVDERWRAERLAERARAEAERANAAKDAFLATLSHELRAPLQGALGWLGLLRSGGLGAEQQAKALTTLERSVRHQAQLVNDLLDVSRIISGKLRVEPSAVDLALVLEQVRDELQLDATSKGVRLAVVSSVDGATVMGDAERLAQIFRNLVANAIKFTPSGGRVAIACET